MSYKSKTKKELIVIIEDLKANQCMCDEKEEALNHAVPGECLDYLILYLEKSDRSGLSEKGMIRDRLLSICIDAKHKGI